MALYSITCNNCGCSCNVPHYLMGKRLKCEHCHREFVAAKPTGKFGATKMAVCVGVAMAIGLGIVVIYHAKGNPAQTAATLNQVVENSTQKNDMAVGSNVNEVDTTLRRSNGTPQGYYKTGLIELKSAPVQKSGTEQPDEIDEKTEAAIEKGITPKIHDGYLRFSPKMERY